MVQWLVVHMDEFSEKPSIGSNGAIFEQSLCVQPLKASDRQRSQTTKEFLDSMRRQRADPDAHSETFDSFCSKVNEFQIKSCVKCGSLEESFNNLELEDKSIKMPSSGKISPLPRLPRGLLLFQRMSSGALDRSSSLRRKSASEGHWSSEEV